MIHIPSAPNAEDVLPFNIVFEAQSSLVLVLSPDLRILMATNAYLKEALMERKDIVGKFLFEVFPDNPDATGESGPSSLKASLQQVFATGKPHQMDLIQYDIPDPARPGKFLERYWATTNVPVLNDKGEIICILHETENITEKEKTKLQLIKSQEREQEALAQAEQQKMRLERLFEQAPAAMAILEGPDLVFKVINSSYQQLFPGRKLLELPLFDALSELRGTLVYDIIYKVYNTGETFEGKEILIPVARFENQAPEDIYWNFIYQAVYDKEGKINGILIFALDVTSFVQTRKQVEQTAEALRSLNQDLEKRVEERTKELKLAQAETKRQWQQLEDLFMHAPSAICFLKGPDFTFQLINPVYQQIFPGRNLLNKPLLEALPELVGTKIPDLFQQVYQTGNNYEEQELPLMMARHEGGPLEEICWNFTYQARRSSAGEIDGVMVFAQEVTNQVKNRVELEEYAKRLQLITDALPVLIGYVDKEERYQFVNRAYEEWFALKREELLGKTVIDLVGEPSYQRVKSYIRRALAGERLDFETAMPYQHGFTKHIRTSYVPDVQDKEVKGFYAMVTDVTEQVLANKQLEQSAFENQKMAKELAETNESLRLANLELSRANDQLIHTNIDLDNFIYTASHDLKAPISNIEMLIEELLLELPEDTLVQGETSRIINLIKNAIERFKKTIFNLTEITRLQKGNDNLAIMVDVAEVLKDVQLDLEQLIISSGAQVQTYLQSQRMVSFSPKNMRSIVYNLISNAIKYRHPERIPEVRVNFSEEENYFVFTVQDNGLGLSPDNQAKLFNIFRRFHDHVEGTGIGLYMVKRIVDNAGGKIEVDSELGVGTTFRVYFKKE